MEQLKSEYFKKLESAGGDVVDRYKLKLGLINNVDPYVLKDDDLRFEVEVFPAVTAIDIVTYLVLTHSFYTQQQMKAYKSLLGYKYFEAGFVQKIGAVKINERVVVVGTVKHSQRMTEAPLKVWLICEEDGSVRNGHCTCMAGAGEACSHVAAILYSLEYIHINRSNISCTDVKAYWKVPTVTKVPIVKLSELRWRSIKPSVTINTKRIIPPIKDSELQTLLSECQSAGTSAALMSVVEPFASSVAIDRTPQLPSIYVNLYRPEHENKSYEELLQLVMTVPENITPDDCVAINNATKEQSRSREWFNQRSGRITASNFKRACKTSISKPSVSLIKSICYPLLHNFKTKATNWGLSHEINAISDYVNYQRLTHRNFNVERCGLIINPQFPAFGASPDGLQSCDCCGEGTVEVKCPYVLRNMDIVSYANGKNSCLTVIDGDIGLKKDHAYYYQVQLQMKVTNLPFCSFVLWSPNEIFVETILSNEDFWACEYPKAKQFHEKVILPELLGRLYTNDASQSWCCCKSMDDGRPMIKCDNDNCEIQWYHVECKLRRKVNEGLNY
ncbi:hypothetical protein NQ315_015317 [Exocentrus adspersus]|uniref:SWIM-type domain-containing protein n=1 Tax=Exocentrus adspersus TaxID=1586481 RepID=A0AAV8V6M2_9CUCU|nr:hypothetical protein NQ315_015317 [Exocentrus adspersus]